MAKYDIEFSCGHTESRDIIGKVKDRESKAEWLAGGLCSECWEAEKLRQFEDKNKRAVAEAAEYGLPELTGSEKQVAWANTLRQQWIAEAESYIEGYEELSAKPGKEEEVRKIIAGMKKAKEDRLLSETSARFWIDGRESSASRYLKDAGQKALREVVEVPQEVRQQALEEMVIRPSEPITGLVTDIRVMDNLVSAKHPEKNEDFRLLLRGLRFDWSNDHWERKTNEVVGGSLDRASELAIKLLAAGFPIRVYSEELQRKILAGEFAPECDRWVMIHEKGFRVYWRREEDFYNAAKRLPGAQWLSGMSSMYVPKEAFREIQDFADRYAFKITEKAQARLIEAQQAFESAMVADVTVPEREELPQPGDVPEKLEVEDFEIDESLKEDEGMELCNTSEKLIDMIKKDAAALGKDAGQVAGFCEELAAAVLPDLEGDYEYTHRQHVADGQLSGTEILSHRRYWDEKLNCWNWDDAKIIATLSSEPY